MRGQSKESKPGYKYAKIKTDLSIQILEGRLHPHDRIPSLNEIASKYKVSKITARRVLNDLVNEGFVYTSRGRGSFVAESALRQNSRMAATAGDQLGVVFDHSLGSFMSDIIMGIDEEAFHHKTQINLCLSNSSYEREAENLQRLAGQGIKKILLYMVSQNDDKAMNPNISLYLRLQEQGMQLLLLACHISGFPLPAITYDDYNAFVRLVKFMKDRGCKHLAFAMRIDNASTTSERFRGYKDGLLECGLSYNENRLIRSRIESPDTVVSNVSESFLTFLKSGAPADAVLCTDEMVASGIFTALGKAGIPPHERPLVGGMCSNRNIHVLKGNPYVMLEDDTHRLGVEAASIILNNDLPASDERNLDQFHRVISVPLRVPRKLR